MVKAKLFDLMPGLVNAGYNPAGVGMIIDRRMNAPEDVVEVDRFIFCTAKEVRFNIISVSFNL